MIKMFPLIRKFKDKQIQYETLFSGQHKDLFSQFKNWLPEPDYTLDTMEHGQSLNKLSSKIYSQLDAIDLSHVSHVIVQGDTTTAYTMAMAAFNQQIKVIHLEAGLRTHNKYSPFPEEMNRCLISKIADIHLCPTAISVENLRMEGITENVYLVGNTVVDAFDLIGADARVLALGTVARVPDASKTLLVTLHRRENRDKMYILWDQINILAKTHRIVYIIHPSLKDAFDYLDERIIKLHGLDYCDMVKQIKNSVGIITDSGGLQEEAICAGKKVLVCRDTTERPETIESGWGKLVGTDILGNIDFLDPNGLSVCGDGVCDKKLINPYGDNVCEKIVGVLKLIGC
jgi:UDP-N-acetylglucosamine 2-epimerase (non-hydrolysing)